MLQKQSPVYATGARLMPSIGEPHHIVPSMEHQMAFVELRSKLIDALEYDKSNSHLKIFLSNGQLREFREVPEFVVDDLKASGSPGTYYMKLIRDRYPPA